MIDDPYIPDGPEVTEKDVRDFLRRIPRLSKPFVDVVTRDEGHFKWLVAESDRRLKESAKTDVDHEDDDEKKTKIILEVFEELAGTLTQAEVDAMEMLYQSSVDLLAVNLGLLRVLEKLDKLGKPSSVDDGYMDKGLKADLNTLHSWCIDAYRTRESGYVLLDGLLDSSLAEDPSDSLDATHEATELINKWLMCVR